jgi:hypothetical protein
MSPCPHTNTHLQRLLWSPIVRRWECKNDAILTCRNGSIKKAKTNRYPSLKGTDPKFRRNHRHALHGTMKALVRTAPNRYIAAYTRPANTVAEGSQRGQARCGINAHESSTSEQRRQFSFPSRHTWSASMAFGLSMMSSNSSVDAVSTCAWKGTMNQSKNQHR